MYYRKISVTVRRRSLRNVGVTAGGLPDSGGRPSNDIRPAARAPTVLRLVSLSFSDVERGETICWTEVLTSSALEDVVEIVRFR